jgi:hypothetical protein
MLAAVRMNDWFLCCIATPATELMQPHLCCARMQLKPGLMYQTHQVLLNDIS